MSISVTNTDANLSAKTIVTAEGADTVTGLKTFDRDPSAPFAVTSGSAVVTNLDADKLDGKDAPTGSIVGTSDAQTLTNKILTAPSIDTITLTSGQISFPAVQNASAGANVLDDYEEGSWTPTITSAGGGTPTYTTQVGKYIKVGKKVFVTGKVQLATKGTLAAGSVSIGGLPFATENTASQVAAASFGLYSFTTAIVSIFGNIAENTTSIGLFHNAGAATSTTASQVSDLSATSVFSFSATYVASA